jgi:hypothetical protein
VPTTIDGWIAEVLAGMDHSQDAAESAGVGEDDGAAWRRFVEEQAVARALAARGHTADEAAPADMDAITDTTLALRRAAPGDPDDLHIDAFQHYLLYYLAAHVHAGSLDQQRAGAVARDCWDVETGEEDAAADEESDDGDEEDAEPWPIKRRTPATVNGWTDEVVASWKRAANPPPLTTEDGQAFIPEDGGLLEAGVILTLHNRGARVPVEAVYGLIGVIEEMARDLGELGPEWQQMQQAPPLEFTIYYVWAHIVIGHLDEEKAIEIVHACTEALARFG